MSKPRVLFLCTHNSARSQMTEGFLRVMAGDRFAVQIAGTEQTSCPAWESDCTGRRGSLARRRE